MSMEYGPEALGAMGLHPLDDLLTSGALKRVKPNDHDRRAEIVANLIATDHNNFVHFYGENGNSAFAKTGQKGKKFRTQPSL